MSSCEVAQFLRKKAEESSLSHTEITRLAKVSRQTWYKLLNGDVQEAKLSTIIRISEALHIHPLDLMVLYFERRQRRRLHDPFYVDNFDLHTCPENYQRATGQLASCLD